MAVYTVHQPPLGSGAAAAEPYRFVFVRDGFSWWAFLLTPFWMLRHRLWLVLAIYLLLSAALDVGLRALGASALTLILAGVLISFLAGLEGGTLRRFKLARHWRNIGVVTGDRLEDAERRFFDAWIRQAPARRPGLPPSASMSGSVAPAPSAPSAASSSVIGLFPEPGAQR